MDWTKFNRKIRLNVSAQRIYDSWTKTTELKKWFLKDAIIIQGSSDGICRKGDKVEWHWNNACSVETFEILEANGKDQLSFTFGGEMIVDLIITPEESMNILHLVQHNIPTDDKAKMNYYAGCKGGWTFWLANLKAYLEHQIVLHDPKLGNREDLYDFSNS